MKSHSKFLLQGALLAASVLGACSAANAPGGHALDGAVDMASDASEGRDAFVAPLLDAGDMAVSRSCTRDDFCDLREVCLGGLCQPDPCIGDEEVCGDSEGSCRARCVATRDPCAGVTCDEDQTCIDGRCIAGCLPVTCAGVVCALGEFCDRSSGRCASITACDAACGEGYACHKECIPADPCQGVECEQNEFCVEGECRTNNCFGVECALGQVCSNGSCIETCNCTPECDGDNERCVFGHCVCTPSCAPDAQCGDDDGCGGRCTGSCEDPTQRCDAETLTCVCRPDCEGRVCGDDDGCGGMCTGGCDSGERCNTTAGECECDPSCPARNTAACGTAIANRCAGGPACPGGTMCPSGQACSAGGVCECAPACPARNSVACGTPIMNRCPGGPACAGGTMCPSGQRCNSSGACECAPSCAAPSSVACGTPITNRCPSGPACPSGTRCASGQICASGACCTPTCAASLPCGTTMPDGCGGTCAGNTCESGYACNTTTRMCECVPFCGPSAECGSSDGCGGECAGTCGAGNTCAELAEDEGNFECVPSECPSGCPCGTVCVRGECANLCRPGTTLCGCGACCGPDEICSGSECITLG